MEDKSIDYIFILRETPIYYYFISCVLGVMLYFALGNRRKTYWMIVPYMFFVLAITVLSRNPWRTYIYQVIPFWSYIEAFRGSNEGIVSQILANLLLFVPVGVLLMPSIGSVKKTVLIGLLFSMLIEVLQLLTKRGLFEFDDIIHNTIGCALGCGIYLLINYLHRRRKIME